VWGDGGDLSVQAVGARQAIGWVGLPALHRSSINTGAPTGRRMAVVPMSGARSSFGPCGRKPQPIATIQRTSPVLDAVGTASHCLRDQADGLL
jgi:hypothetical protein